jgi:hypothetical protein
MMMIGGGGGTFVIGGGGGSAGGATRPATKPIPSHLQAQATYAATAAGVPNAVEVLSNTNAWRAAAVVQRQETGGGQVLCQFLGFGPEHNLWLAAAMPMGGGGRLRFKVNLQSQTGAPRQATVAVRSGDLLLCHYDGFDSGYDEWIPNNSGRIDWSPAGGAPFGMAAGPPSGVSVAQIVGAPVQAVEVVAAAAAEPVAASVGGGGALTICSSCGTPFGANKFCEQCGSKRPGL